ncbi:uncharacterized protein G2W53_023654 [Senna tora]|uniref:Uncharacterized protein n=1 Tax=Senna tora TaxID=362788 RepID=A0A834TAZ0_9FABA|nr:uncharacterized protein G2W53_023654 [Senna tora]
MVAGAELTVDFRREKQILPLEKKWRRETMGSMPTYSFRVESFLSPSLFSLRYRFLRINIMQ